MLMLVVTSSSVRLSLNTVDDHSRVILKLENNQSRSDYINASPIVSSHAHYLHILCIMSNNGSEHLMWRKHWLFLKHRIYVRFCQLLGLCKIYFKLSFEIWGLLIFVFIFWFICSPFLHHCSPLWINIDHSQTVKYAHLCICRSTDTEALRKQKEKKPLK